MDSQALVRKKVCTIHSIAINRAPIIYSRINKTILYKNDADSTVYTDRRHNYYTCYICTIHPNKKSFFNLFSTKGIFKYFFYIKQKWREYLADKAVKKRFKIGVGSHKNFWIWKLILSLNKQRNGHIGHNKSKNIGTVREASQSHEIQYDKELK